MIVALVVVAVVVEVVVVDDTVGHIGLQLASPRERQSILQQFTIGHVALHDTGT